jgi:hypothetical protein
MSKVEAVIISWDRDKAHAMAEDVKALFAIQSHIVCDQDHETALLNRGLDLASKAEYVWFLDPGLEFVHGDVLRLMVDWLDARPKVGLMVPNREAEPANDALKPFTHYLADGSAFLYRNSVQARFDEEFIFTGWSDLDFGESVRDLGYVIQVDPRRSIHKRWTAYGDWSSFRRAYDARNRLLLEAKWYWSVDPSHGILVRDWRGVEDWNERHPERRIPTMFEMAWWGELAQNAFAESVYMEHPQILTVEGKGSGNENWRYREFQ